MGFILIEENGMNQIPSIYMRKYLAENYIRVFPGGGGTSGFQYRTWDWPQASDPQKAQIKDTIPMSSSEYALFNDLIRASMEMNFIAYNYDPSGSDSDLDAFNKVLSGNQLTSPITVSQLIFFPISMIP